MNTVLIGFIAFVAGYWLCWKNEVVQRNASIDKNWMAKADAEWLLETLKERHPEIIRRYAPTLRHWKWARHLLDLD